MVYEDPWWTDESLPAIIRAARDGDLQSSRKALRAREAPLPLPWEAYRDDAGQLYYHNRETGESVWTLPDELLCAPAPAPSPRTSRP